MNVLIACLCLALGIFGLIVSFVAMVLYPMYMVIFAADAVVAGCGISVGIVGIQNRDKK